MRRFWESIGVPVLILLVDGTIVFLTGGWDFAGGMRIDIVTPLLIAVANIVLCCLTVLWDRYRIRHGKEPIFDTDMPLRQYKQQTACSEALLPATVDDREARERLQLIRSTDCVYDRPVPYRLGEVPLRLRQDI